jgi:hypothetical protein
MRALEAWVKFSRAFLNLLAMTMEAPPMRRVSSDELGVVYSLCPSSYFDTRNGFGGSILFQLPTKSFCHNYVEEGERGQPCLNPLELLKKFLGAC